MADQPTCGTSSSVVWQAMSFVLFKTWKWLVHLFTGKPEIYRICMNYPGDQASNIFQRTVGILRSIRASRVSALREVASDPTLVASSAARIVMTLKTPRGASESVLGQYRLALRPSCALLVDLAALKRSVPALRAELYSSQDQRHEEQLLELWRVMMPGTELSGRVSEQWKDLGFQGKDPATDFRGMGLLGLRCLLNLGNLRGPESRRALGLSHHPTLGYPFAITAINMTAVVYQLTDSHQLDRQYLALSSAAGGDATSEGDDATQERKDAAPEYLFYQVFMSVFLRFDQFWRDSNPVNIMDFAKVKEKFLHIIHTELSTTGKLSFVTRVDAPSKDGRPL